MPIERKAFWAVEWNNLEVPNYFCNGIKLFDNREEADEFYAELESKKTEKSRLELITYACGLDFADVSQQGWISEYDL